MALSLSDIERRSSTRKKTSSSRKPQRKNRTRPWQTPHLDFSEGHRVRSTPSLLDLENNPWPTDTTPPAVLADWLHTWVTQLQQRSYTLSQWTYARSWWSRLQLRPRLRIPLPRHWVVEDR